MVWGQVSEDRNIEENTETESDAVKMNLKTENIRYRWIWKVESGKAGISSPTLFEIRMDWRMQNFSGAARIMII